MDAFRKQTVWMTQRNVDEESRKKLKQLHLTGVRLQSRLHIRRRAGPLFMPHLPVGTERIK